MNYLFNLHKHLPFLPERKKVFYLHEDLSSLLKRKKLEGVKKFVCSIEDKEKYLIHISALKQPLNHVLKLENVHKVIQFNQQVWLKPYIDMNARLRKEGKNEFEKDFFKLINNSVFGKIMENLRNHGATDEKRNKLVSEP